MILKLPPEDGEKKRKWYCSWCNSPFTPVNATKALAHVLKLKGFSVRSCPSVILPNYEGRYQELFDRGVNEKKSKKDAGERISRRVEGLQASINESVRQKRKRGGASAAASLVSTGSVEGASERSSKRRMMASTGHPSSTSKRSLTQSSSSLAGTQTTMHSYVLARSLEEEDEADGRSLTSFHGGTVAQMGNQVEMDHALDTAIAEFCFREGLPFSIVEKPSFTRVIKCAKFASQHYSPPGRDLIRTTYLDASYEAYMKDGAERLLLEGDTFGGSLMADGATVRTMPLTNILASGYHQKTIVLEIVDCTGHLAGGGKKDARFIAGLFKPHMDRIDPEKKFFDVVFFDGASNMQNAGTILQVSHPRLFVMHGVEHVVSLFFTDIMKLDPLKQMMKESRYIYRFFGGPRHGPHALLGVRSREFNCGRYIGFIRPSPTRMFGHFYTFHRELRLRGPAQAVVTSAQWTGLEMVKHKKEKVSNLLMSANFWERRYAFCRCTIWVCKLLRLADSCNRPGMEYAYYLVRKASLAIERSVEIFDSDIFSAGTMNISEEEIKEFPLDDDDEVDASDGEGEEGESDGEQDTVSAEERGMSFGERIKHRWERRKKTIVNDLTRAGWMLSSDPAVMKDCLDNYGKEDQDALLRVVRKMLIGRYPEDKIEAKVDIFLDEWLEYQNKTGQFHERPEIWKARERAENTCDWAKKYLLKYTEVLGWIICRVCSKVLGVGTCERAWKDVKKMKTSQRGSMQIDSTEKQSTIYGMARIEEEAIRRDERKKYLPNVASREWTEEDEHLDLHLEEWGDEMNVPEPVKLTRTFKAWLEDWERDGLMKFKRKNDIFGEKLNMKYGGLRFYDIDLDDTLVIMPNSCEWYRESRGKKARWVFHAYREGFDIEDDPSQEEWDENVHVYEINAEWCRQIAQVEQDMTLNVTIEKPVDWISSDDDKMERRRKRRLRKTKGTGGGNCKGTKKKEQKRGGKESTSKQRRKGKKKKKKKKKTKGKTAGTKQRPRGMRRRRRRRKGGDDDTDSVEEDSADDESSDGSEDIDIDYGNSDDDRGEEDSGDNDEEASEDDRGNLTAGFDDNDVQEENLSGLSGGEAHVTTRRKKRGSNKTATETAVATTATAETATATAETATATGETATTTETATAKTAAGPKTTGEESPPPSPPKTPETPETQRVTRAMRSAEKNEDTETEGEQSPTKIPTKQTKSPTESDQSPEKKMDLGEKMIANLKRGQMFGKALTDPDPVDPEPVDPEPVDTTKDTAAAAAEPVATRSKATKKKVTKKGK